MDDHRGGGTDDTEEEGKQHEGEEEEGEGDDESEGQDDDDDIQSETRSPESYRRHHKAGQTPAPVHMGTPGQPTLRSDQYDKGIGDRDQQRQTKRTPTVNYRLEIQGRGGDISLMCDCTPKHLKACKRGETCKCRWAKRFHTDECNEIYASAAQAAQHASSEDEDEEPDERYRTAPGIKHTLPIRKGNKVGQVGAQSTPSTRPQDNDERTREMSNTSSKGMKEICSILQGTLEEIRAERVDRSAKNKDRWKDVAAKIQQVTPESEKDLKIIAQLYHKAEGEGQVIAEEDIIRIVDNKGSRDITRHQSKSLKRRKAGKHSLSVHREIAKDYIANKFSASAVGVAIHRGMLILRLGPRPAKPSYRLQR